MTLRLVTFADAGQLVPGALVDDDTIVSLIPTLARCGIEIRSLRDGLAIWPRIIEVLSDELKTGRASLVRRNQVRLGPPIPDPAQVIAVGFNYPSHIAVMPELSTATGPVFFMKTTTSISGPHDPIVAPATSHQLDYEIEVAIVVGKPGYKVSREQASSHIFGYLLANDITARDVALPYGPETSPLQAQIVRSKGFPTFCPTGPWLLPASNNDTEDFDLELCVNGELRQSGSTKDMILSFSEIIESVTTTIALRAGDLILTGTPAGCGFALDPPRFLSPGDVIEAQSSRLGAMRLPVVADGGISVGSAT